MKLNKKLLEEFKNSNSKLLAVSKYLEKEDTNKLYFELFSDFKDVVVGLGENRLKSLKQKELKREDTQFIGNLQTKELKYIVEYCDTIHSLDNIKHLRKLEEICSKKDTWVKVFLQINVDESKPGGINKDEIPNFLEELKDYEYVSLIGFSAIGKAEFSIEEKIEEFRLLKNLKAKYLPNGLISAGTSRDYKLALEEKIDIIRIGKALYL